MTVIVGTDSYATEAELLAYATARGITISGDQSQLLIKAMDWLESNMFDGAKRDYTQTLKWPRYSSSNYGDFNDPWIEYPLDSNNVPLNIKNAQIAAALIYDAGGDPIGAISRTVKREKVDVLEVEYSDNAAAVTLYPILTSLLAPFMSSNGTSFKVSRG